MRLLPNLIKNERAELVERLREDYRFNPFLSVSTPKGHPPVRGMNEAMYERLVLKESLDLLGEEGTKEALEMFNYRLPNILSEVLGRNPGNRGTNTQCEIDCANNSFVKFVGYLGLNPVSAEEGIEGFIGTLELDLNYL